MADEEGPDPGDEERSTEQLQDPPGDRPEGPSEAPSDDRTDEKPEEGSSDASEEQEHEHTWLDSLDGHEVGDTLGMKLFKLIIPFAIPAAIFAFLFTMMDYSRWLQLGALALGYLFPPFGKESIIPIGIGYGFTVLQMTGLILMVDVVCAMFISWNLPLAKKIPLIGRLLIWLEKKGGKVLEDNPRLRAGAWFALVAWVMIPFQGSGGITASIVGRAVGMRATYVITAVATGALIAGLVIGVIAEKGWEVIQENLLLGIAYILAVVLALLLIYNFIKWYQRRLDAPEA